MLFEEMNLAILVSAALVAAAAFTSVLSFRFGAPLLLVFLAVGLVAGEDGLGIRFDDYAAAYFIGSVALAIILFDAGYATRLTTLRLAAAPAVVLATAGVVVTALFVGLAAQFLFAFTFMQGLLLGVVVASTDAAAVFFLLNVGGLTLRDLVRSTLEIESGTNDPVAIFLTLALVGILSTGGAFDWGTVLQLAGQLIIGLAVGVLGGAAIIQIVRRTRFEPALYPIIVTALALATFALTSLAFGSGFLAVYVAGLMAGNARLPHSVTVTRFQAATTWLAQIVMFVALGLLATPSEFAGVALSAMALSAFLMLVARPVAVWLCLLPFRFTRHEMAFVSWVGLRGAVSILLAVVPIIGNVPGGEEIFNTAFVVVLTSLLVQGWSIGPVARFLGMAVPPRGGPVERLELELPGRGDHEIVVYVVHPESAVARGERIPRWARPSLVIRDGRTLRPHRFGRPQAGDQIYVITTPEYIAILDKLFAGQGQAIDDPDLYGEFAIDPDARLGDIASIYPATVPKRDEAMTVRAFLRRQLAGDIERGDRIALGAVDLIVRRVNGEHEIEEVGLAMQHAEEARPRIPIFQNPKEISDLVRGWFGQVQRGVRSLSGRGRTPLLAKPKPQPAEPLEATADPPPAPADLPDSPAVDAETSSDPRPAGSATP